MINDHEYTLEKVFSDETCGKENGLVTKNDHNGKLHTTNIIW